MDSDCRGAIFKVLHYTHYTKWNIPSWANWEDDVGAYQTSAYDREHVHTQSKSWFTLKACRHQIKDKSFCSHS